MDPWAYTSWALHSWGEPFNLTYHVHINLNVPWSLFDIKIDEPLKQWRYTFGLYYENKQWFSSLYLKGLYLPSAIRHQACLHYPIFPNGWSILEKIPTVLVILICYLYTLLQKTLFHVYYLLPSTISKHLTKQITILLSSSLEKTLRACKSPISLMRNESPLVQASSWNRSSFSSFLNVPWRYLF